MSPVFQDCERASKCTLASRGTWLSKPVRSRCFCTVDFASEGLNTNCRHLFVRKPLPRGLMPGHNRGCLNRQSIGADAWHVLSQRNSANSVVRLYLSFPGEEFHIKAGQQTQELATPGQSPDREPGEHGDCREAQHGGDDQIGKGHAREPRHEGEGQVRSQPGDTQHRLAWHEGETRLKCRNLIEVNLAFTSQSCNACGITDPGNRNDRTFECVACGHADHADLNAARNILTSGTGVSARRGALAPATPVTRETDRKLAA